MVFKKGLHPKTEFKKGNKICVGRILSDDTKRKIGMKNKGMKRTEEVKRKLSLSHKNIPRTEEWKKKISESNKGKIRSEEHRKHISEAKKKLFKEGKLKPINYWLGKSHSEKYKRRMHENHIHKGISKGIKNAMWKGGISFEPYTPEFNRWLKEQIRQRNNLRCRLCGIKQNGHKLDVHHTDYDKKNCSLENLISLCRPCHIKTNANRDWWQLYFVNKEMI